jgi:hypothetical protein
MAWARGERPLAVKLSRTLSIMCKLLVLAVLYESTL